MSKCKYNFSVISEDRVVGVYREARDKRYQIKVMADLLCCTQADVRELLISRGCELEVGKARKRTPRKNDWREDEVELIINMYDCGASVEQMAAKVGRSRNAVRTKLKKNGRLFRKRKAEI